LDDSKKEKCLYNTVLLIEVTKHLYLDLSMLPFLLQRDA